MQINIKNLVVGDICCIKYGDLLAADGLIIHSSDLKVDESSLTGETDLVKKNEYDVSLLAGNYLIETNVSIIFYLVCYFRNPYNGRKW